MRRPVGVKGIRLGICWSRCFFPAESPLSPPLYLLCFEHVDNLGAYSNPVRKPAFSSHLFTRIRRCSTLPQQSRGCLFLIGAPLYREALV